MRISTLLFILTFLFQNNGNSQSIEELQSLKQTYDSIRTTNKNSQIILVRTIEEGLIKVTDGNWPENIVSTYNILVKRGRTLIISIYPYSESGDWSREHTYYFDSTEKLFAYNHKLNSFNNICAEITKQNTLFYYNQFSNVLSKEYTIRDKDGVNLKDKNCIFNYPYNHQPYMNLEEIKNEEKLIGW